MSGNYIQELLRLKGVKIPTGRERCIEKALDAFREVVKARRRELRAVEAKAEQARLAESMREHAALMIQCLVRMHRAYKELLRLRQLAWEEAERVRIAAETAANWQRAQDHVESAVVWLHGQGETEVGWQDLLGDFQAPKAAGRCRWLWPRAMVSACTARGGAQTVQWFDTPEFPIRAVVRGVPDRKSKSADHVAVERAVRVVHAVLDALVAEGMPSERIVLGGFGQGAALAAHAVLRYKHPLAGGALLCAWVPCFQSLEEAVTPAGLSTPLLWLHGARDAVVHTDVAMAHVRRLQAELGARLNFRVFPELGFGVSSPTMGALKAFIAARLDPDAEEEAAESSDDESLGGDKLAAVEAASVKAVPSVAVA